MKQLIEMEEIFKKTDLHYDIDWLHTNQQISYTAITDDTRTTNYKICLYMLNIFCLQEMREVAYSVSEDFEHDIELSVGDYLFILQELDIDVNIFKTMVDSEFYKSDEDGANSQLLTYLINQNYYHVSKKLINHYKNYQQLLESIIKDFDIYATYQDALENIENLEDCLDYSEILKLYSWADSGFDISGES